MVKAADETVLERVMRLEPQAAVLLDSVEDKEQLKTELEKIVDFLQSHELRPGDNKFSHINYAGIAKTWYSSLSGRYTFTPEDLPMLYSSMVKLAGLGIPLELVECKEGRLTVFPLHFDIDVKLSNPYDPMTVEREIVDESDGFRFFKAIAGLINGIYDDIGEMIVFTASGTSRSESETPETAPQKKVSFRIVFPDIVVDKERAQLIWQHVTGKLMSLSAEETQSAYLKNLLRRLRQLSPANESFQRVVDESVIRCKHGVRMPFSDKVEKSRSAGRVMIPLIGLRFEKENGAMVVTKRPGTTDMELVSWLERGALSTPSLKHYSLTEWNRPNVRITSRVTKTGASGSSLALARLSTADAARAAERADNRRRMVNSTTKETNEPLRLKFIWESGSIQEFRKKVRVGADRNFEESPDGRIVWKNPRRLADTVAFNPNTKVIELEAGNQLRMEFIRRSLADIKDLQSCSSFVKAPEVRSSPMKQMKATAAFVATEQGEVSIEEGEIVTLIDSEDDQWSQIRKSDTSQGFVPSAFLEPLVAE
jgi:hypothetical protein